MVSKLRREGQGLITVRIGNHEFPVALRVGRKVYRVCPVCGAIFSSSTGWKKHIDAYHPEFFDYVSTLRIKELMEIKDIAETGKSCIDKLIVMIPDDAEIYYMEYNGQGYDAVGYTDKKSLINFLSKFKCTEIDLRMVRYVKGTALIGKKKKVNKYFRVPTGEGKAIRFTINQSIIEAMIGNRIIKPLQTQKQKQ